MPTWFWYTLPSLSAAIAGGISTAYFRYKRSITKDAETFARFFFGTIRLRAGRYVSKTLARQLAVRQYAEMRLSMFDTHLIVPAVEDAQIEIDTAYVPLSLSKSGERILDSDLLETRFSGSLLIFGEAGSGKSSLTKKLFRNMCRQVYRAPSVNRLPIHIELRTIEWHLLDTSRPGTSLHEQVFSRASEGDGVHNARFVLDAIANTTGLVVLLDGLDEVPQNHLGIAVSAIEELSKELRGRSTSTTVITTARTQMRGNLPRNFLGSKRAIFTLDPFTPGDIFEFVYRWPFENAGIGEAHRVFSTIHEHRTLAEMCTNPLILSMYVAQDQRYQKSRNLNPIRLPDTRTGFYSSVIGELLLYRRGQQLGKVAGGTATRKEREELLGKIALEHLYQTEDPANSVSWAAALSCTMKFTGISSEPEGERYLRDLAVETGIFEEERKGETLRFMHLTLCEYLAAKEATENKAPTINQLASAVANKSVDTYSGRLTEVLIFAVALLKRADRDEALASFVAHDFDADLILRIVRECQAYGLPVFDQCVDEAIKQLSRSATWDEIWFRRLRLIIGCVDDFARSKQGSPTSDVRDIASVFEQLSINAHVELKNLFTIWLQENPVDALSYIEKAGIDYDYLGDEQLLEAMERPELLTFAVSRFLSKSGPSRIWALLLAEAALRSRLVAESLLREPLSNSDAMLLRKDGWHSLGVTQATLYGAVLDVACDEYKKVQSVTQKRNLAKLGLISYVQPKKIHGNPGLIFSSAFPRVVVLTTTILATIMVFTLVFDSIWGHAVLIKNFPFLTGALVVASVLLARWRLAASEIIPSHVTRAILNLSALPIFQIRDIELTISCALLTSDSSATLYVFSNEDAKVAGLESYLERPVHPFVTMFDGINFSMLDLRGLPPDEAATFILLLRTRIETVLEGQARPRPRLLLARQRQVLNLIVRGSPRRLLQ